MFAPLRLANLHKSANRTKNTTGARNVNSIAKQAALWHCVCNMREAYKDVRLPIMVTADEAKTIDDWRFDHRVNTRAEAIRQLIRLGLDLPRLCVDLLDAIEAEGFLEYGDIAKPVAALEAYLGTEREGGFPQKRK